MDRDKTLLVCSGQAAGQIELQYRNKLLRSQKVSLMQPGLKVLPLKYNLKNLRNNIHAKVAKFTDPLVLHSLRDACGTQLGLAVKARLLSLLKEPVYSQRHRQSGVAGQRGLRQIRFMQGGLIQCGLILGGGEGDPELCQRDRRWGRCGGDWAWGYLATCADATDQCAAAGCRTYSSACHASACPCQHSNRASHAAAA